MRTPCTALYDTVATKEDLEELRIATKEDLVKLDNKIDKVEVNLKQEIKDVETRLDHRIDLLGRDIKIWSGSMAILLFSALAMLKYFG